MGTLVKLFGFLLVIAGSIFLGGQFVSDGINSTIDYVAIVAIIVGIIIGVFSKNSTR